ncbi:hypothetical protein ACVRXQ_11970 [Streptococcus panodentis]|uniref:hypothetical protein n=1 Tax=Streptococcus panodentis TaxID=1581472 RepID=UPI001AEA8AC6|nr:hypothetical protein [Streptococcus panodentis]
MRLSLKEKVLVLQYTCATLVILVITTAIGIWGLESQVSRLEFVNERHERMIDKFNQKYMQDQAIDKQELRELVAKVMQEGDSHE